MKITQEKMYLAMLNPETDDIAKKVITEEIKPAIARAMKQQTNSADGYALVLKILTGFDKHLKELIDIYD